MVVVVFLQSIVPVCSLGLGRGKEGCGQVHPDPRIKKILADLSSSLSFLHLPTSSFLKKLTKSALPTICFFVHVSIDTDDGSV